MWLIRMPSIACWAVMAGIPVSTVPLVSAGHMVCGDAHRPFLGGGHLLPVGVGELLDGGGQLGGLGLVLLRQRFGSCAHGRPPGKGVRPGFDLPKYTRGRNPAYN